MRPRDEIIAKFARKAEEKLLLARAFDKYESYTKTGRAAATHFLSPAESALVLRALAAAGAAEPELIGGYPGSERAAAVFSQDGKESGRDFVSAVRVRVHEGSGLSHRDYLGALLALGVKREAVGDLLVRPDGCDIVAARELCPFIAENLTSVGRECARVEEIALGDLIVPEAVYKLIRGTVASLRLDSVLGEAFSLSRSDAAALVRSGAVRLDHEGCDKPDKPVSQGCVLSARGYGRAEIVEAGGVTKKGRVPVLIKKYV